MWFSEFFSEMISNFSNPLYLIGQIIGFLLIIESFFIFIQRKRSSILVLKLISDVGNIAQLAFTGIAMGQMTWASGALLNAIAIGRETVFYNRGKKKWANHICWLFIFASVVFFSTFLTPALNAFFEALINGNMDGLATTVSTSYVEFFSDPNKWVVSFLPSVGSVFAVVGYYCLNTKITRILVFIGTSLWFVYSILIQNPMSIISNIITLISLVIGIVQEFKLSYKVKNAHALPNVEYDNAEHNKSIDTNLDTAE